MSLSKPLFCKKEAFDADGCSGGCGLNRGAHDAIYIRKHTKACAGATACKVRMPKNAPAGSMCSRHYKMLKDTEAKKRQDQYLAGLKKKPCKFAHQTARGCEDPECPFSHDREVIKAGTGKYDCENFKTDMECEVLAGPTLCDNCLGGGDASECKSTDEFYCLSKPKHKYCGACVAQHKDHVAEVAHQKETEKLLYLKANKACKAHNFDRRGCKFGDDCIYSHNYDLIIEQYVTEREEHGDARKICPVTISQGPKDAHDDADPQEIQCKYFCQDGEEMCSYHVYKADKDEENRLSFLEREQRRKEWDAKPLRDCKGPNCIKAKFPAKVKGGLCEENGCRELMNEFKPKDSTLIHFGRAKRPELVFFPADKLEELTQEKNWDDEAEAESHDQ